MKTTRFTYMSLAAALVAAACGGSTSADTADQPGGGTAGNAGTATDGGGGGVTADASGGDAAGGTAGSGGDEAGEGGAGGDNTGGGGSGGGAIVDAGSTCTSCLTSTCGDQAAACFKDAACTCYAECLTGGNMGNMLQCALKCGDGGLAMPPKTATDLVTCGAGSCGQTCLGGGQGDGGGLNFGDGGFNFGDGGLNFADGGGISSGCESCLVQNCAKEQAECQANKTCQCLEGCLGNVTCMLGCGLDPAALASSQAVLTCSMQKCQNKCP